MDFTLTPDQELIRATARELCERELVPNARDWDEAEELPRSLVGTLADAGFLAASLPEELGGGGLDSVSYCLLCEELGRADSSVRGIVSVSNGLYGKTIAKWGSDEQRAEHLPGLASGERLGCYALTEPGCGSDAAALATRAERAGDDWVLSGSKVFITLGSWASTAIVFARTGGERAARHHGVPRPDRRGRLRRDPDEGQARAPGAGHGGARARRRARARLRSTRRGGPGLQGRDVGARQRPHLARRRLRRASPRAASTRASPTPASGGRSGSPWPASSSSSSCSPRCTSRRRPRAS